MRKDLTMETIQHTLLETTVLLEASLDEPRVFSYCEACPDYGLNPSCPKHSFKTTEYLKTYPYVLVVLHTFTKDDSLDTAQSFYRKRSLVEPLLMKLESTETHPVAVISGSCNNCVNDCNKTTGCFNPDLLRYSFESLGFDVSIITEEFFQQELSFDCDQLMMVYGLLFKDHPSPEQIFELENMLNEYQSKQ